MTRKLQTHCLRGHPLEGSNLHTYVDKTGKLRRVCRACAKLRNPFRARLYGITNGEYEQMLVEQHGVCAICGDTSGGRALAVDHDHTTGAIRGLLCSPCNSGIGGLRDDPRLLRRAIAYLEAHARGGTAATASEGLSAKDRTDLEVALDLLIDIFGHDVEHLAQGGSFSSTLMWTHLPSVFNDRYDLHFAVRFLLGTVRIRERVAVGDPSPARCVAEELALHAAVRTAVAEAHDVGDDPKASRVGEILDTVVADLDVALIESGALVSREQALLLGATHLWFDDWFRPFDEASPLVAASLN